MLKLNRIVFRPTERTKEMVRDIMDKKGFRSSVQTVEFCIAEMHNKEFPAYMRGKMGIGDPVEEEKNKIIRKETQEKAKLQLEEAGKKKIAEQLEGKVYMSDGVKMCEYYTYDGKTRYQQTVPLVVLDESMLESQYVPSRKHVEKLQNTGKVNYEISS